MTKNFEKEKQVDWKDGGRGAGLRSKSIQFCRKTEENFSYWKIYGHHFCGAHKHNPLLTVGEFINAVFKKSSKKTQNFLE